MTAIMEEENCCLFCKNYSLAIIPDEWFVSFGNKKRGNYTIAKIISEEMPAYFEGQKSLDEVIGVINSRVGIMVAERG